MLMDFASTIAAFQATSAVVRLRQAPPALDSNGIAQPGAETQTTIVASVQPASGSELRLIDHGYLNREVLAVYTTTEELTQNGPAGVADKILHNGHTYTVLRCDDFSETGGYWCATAVKDIEP